MKRKGLLIVLLGVLLCVIGIGKAYAQEKITYGCSGDVHYVPVLKDEWRAYTFITCNGTGYGVTNPEFETAVKTCYVWTGVEVYGAFGGYDNGYYRKQKTLPIIDYRATS